MMKSISKPALISGLAILLATVSTSAMADTKPKADKPAATATETEIARDNHPRWSSWPDLPERQGGRSYSKLVRPEYGGPVERNFESGRN